MPTVSSCPQGPSMLCLALHRKDLPFHIYGPAPELYFLGFYRSAFFLILKSLKPFTASGPLHALPS